MSHDYEVVSNVSSEESTVSLVRGSFISYPSTAIRVGISGEQYSGSDTSR